MSQAAAYSRRKIRLTVRPIQSSIGIVWGACSCDRLIQAVRNCIWVSEDDYQADVAGSKAKLAEAAKVLWEAKYDADYKRGTTLIIEANRLDKSALQARKMLELSQREGTSLPLIKHREALS